MTSLPPGWRALPEEPTTLAAAPIGLFMCSGELCLKTEYGNNEGRIDAYIVSSGEFFWGGAMSYASQREVIVTPISLYAAPPPPASDVAEMVEALGDLLDVLTIDCGHIQTRRFASLDKSRDAYQRARAALSKFKNKPIEGN